METYRLLLHELGMAQLLGSHVVHMCNGQAAQGAADEFNVITLHIAHHQDLRLRLRNMLWR